MTMFARLLRFGTACFLAGLSLLSSPPVGVSAQASPSGNAPQWTTVGPYADDATAVAVSPDYDNDHSVFLGESYRMNNGQPTVQAVASILRSTDGGATWSPSWSSQSPAGTTQNWLNQIVVSPNFAADRTVFALYAGAAGNGVLRSTDGGASFQVVQVGSSAFSSNSKTLSVSPTFGTDHSVAVTSDSGTSATSFLSTDGGATWQAVTPVGPDGCGGSGMISGGGFLLLLGNGKLGSYVPNANLVCSNNGDQRYASSSDGGQHWTPGGDIQAAVGNGSNFDTQHSRMVAAPGGKVILYTDQYGNLVRSADGGASWQSLISAGSTLGHDNPPDTVAGYGPYYNVQFQSATSVFAVHEWTKLSNPHIYHSSDGGATWSGFWQGNGATAQHGVSSAGTNALYFAVGNEGLLRSTDLGQNWQPVGSYLPQLPAVAPSPNYAIDHSVFTVTFPGGLPDGGQDPSAYGIYRSVNGGATWSEPEAPNPATGGGFGTVFTTSANGGMTLAVSPNFASDHTIIEGDRIGAVAVSHDSGRSWSTSLINGQEGWYVDALAISPNFASDQVEYSGLGNLGYGVVKSNDGGQTWVSDVPKDRFEEITQAQVHGLAVSPEPSGALDVTMAVGSVYLMQDTPGSTIPPEWFDTGLVAWTVTMSPNYQHDCTIYASMWPGPTGIGATLDDGVYVSTNACMANANAGNIKWTRLTNSLPVRDFSTIALSPHFATDHTLFIGSYSSGVYMSTDGGQTWTSFSTGLGNQTVHTLVVAVTGDQSGMLFGATDGGLWQTPVALPASVPALSQSIALTNGWNLVGYSLVPSSTKLADVLASLGSNVDIVYGFDSSKGGALSYFTAPGMRPFNTLTNLLPLHGYWIHTTAASTWTISGTPLTSANALTLGPNWSLIGAGSTTSEPVGTLVTNLGGSPDIVYGFNASQGGALSYFTAPGMRPFNTLNTIQPNQGYWVHLAGPTPQTWTGS